MHGRAGWGGLPGLLATILQLRSCSYEQLNLQDMPTRRQVSEPPCVHRKIAIAWCELRTSQWRHTGIHLDCAIGHRCPGGRVGAAGVSPRADTWVDTRRPGGMLVVYSCFEDHCRPGVATTRQTAGSIEAVTSCTAGTGAGCCSPGWRGLMCESCIGKSRKSTMPLSALVDGRERIGARF